MRRYAELPPWIAPLFLFALNALVSAPAVAGPYSALVAEVETERVLYERNADEPRHPASLTKMMTLYMVFEALTERRLFLDTVFRASPYAVLRAPSRLGLKGGDILTVEEGVLALVTRSANDAAAVIAESMGGSEAAFAERMTQKAHQLGMSKSLFRNASGLPDPNQWTSARDMWRLGKSLYKHFPQFYPYFATGRFEYQGHSFHNHNHLLETYPGTDGIKTGFINASGFNLVASATRNGRRLIGVVFGGSSAKARDAHMREILDDGFAQLEGAPPAIHRVPWERPAAPPVLIARPGTAELVPAAHRTHGHSRKMLRHPPVHAQGDGPGRSVAHASRHGGHGHAARPHHGSHGPKKAAAAPARHGAKAAPQKASGHAPAGKAKGGKSHRK
jgi:D-alanyl-D-alanine carboxypeptidase